MEIITDIKERKYGALGQYPKEKGELATKEVKRTIERFPKWNSLLDEFTPPAPYSLYPVLPCYSCEEGNMHIVGFRGWGAGFLCDTCGAFHGTR